MPEHTLKTVLNLLWFCVILPVGFLRRLTGRGLKQQGWVDVSVTTIDPETFRRQY
ncbi:hypothetical protein ACVNHC_21155 [Pannonibacter sp. Q-1]|uniref:hypothetical protein n=1 Tax=Pannonibacter phragmitetus TaxID=121719 RepID=UPI000A71A65A|nr:hypothetical protein [Pannonibacter phragmitetus]